MGGPQEAITNHFYLDMKQNKINIKIRVKAKYGDHALCTIFFERII